MSIKLTVLDKVVNWLVGGTLFQAVKDSVTAINNKELTGEEKRAVVFAEIKELFADAATVFVNLAIEVAVILLKEKMEAETNGN